MTERKERPQVYIPPEGRGLSIEEEQLLGAIEEYVAKGPKEEWKHFTPQFVDTKAQTVNSNLLVEQINSAAERFFESRISQEEGKVKIKTDLPISIVHMGDTHLGSIDTDTNEVMRKFREIRQTPNMYVVFMSNMIDNAIPSQYPNNMLTNGIPPDKQVLLMRSIAEDLNSKSKVLAAITSPCHEGWTFKHAGQDINALIYGFKGRKFPILQNGGRLHLEVGKQKYMGALYHQVGPF